MEAVRALQDGLQDRQGVDVWHAALRASVSYLTCCDVILAVISPSRAVTYHDARYSPVPLPRPSSNTLDLPHTSHHISPSTSITPSSCPDHTIGRFRSDTDGQGPYLGRRVSCSYQPTPNKGPIDDDELDEEAEGVRKTTLEFMIGLSEAMVRRTGPAPAPSWPTDT